ncbi:MAG: hypothetical protein M3Q97_10260, partial [Bacteroidota bacterium]|nr:hypothetical protein [Bacteroidota bacterium]
MDWDHIKVTGLNGTIARLVIDGDDIRARIRGLDFKEQSGFELLTLNTNFSFTSEQIELASLYLKTPNSEIQDYLKFTYDDVSAFGNFIDSVTMEADFVRSTISLKDLSYFTDALANKTDAIKISTQVRGTISNINLNDLELTFGNESYIKGRAALNGLPDITETFMDVRLSGLHSNAREVARLLPEIPLPQEVYRLGDIGIKGRFTGFINDFVSNSTVTTDIGNVITDVNLKLADNPAYSSYSGKMETQSFNLGLLLANDMLGRITMTGGVEGTGMTIESMKARLLADIQTIDFNQYTYHNVNILGNLENQFFNGDLEIGDDNLDIDFTGSIDNRGGKPFFDFVADIRKANLRNLHFTKDTINLVTRIDIELYGTDPDEIEGQVRAHGTKIITPGYTYNMDTVKLISSIEPDHREILFTSELLDATLTGQFTPTKLPSLFKTAAAKYIDSSFLPEGGEVIQDQFVNFDIRYRDANDLLRLLNTGIVLHDTGFINGSIHSDNGQITLNGNIPGIQFNDYRLEYVRLDGQSVGNELNLNVNIAGLFIEDSLLLRDISLKSFAKVNDAIRFDAYAADEDRNKRAHLFGNFDINGPLAVLTLDTSIFFIADTTWNIVAEPVTFHESGLIEVPYFSLNQGNQHLKLIGKYDSEVSHPIRVVIENVSMKTLTAFAPQFSAFGGELNGQVMLEDINTKPKINAGLFISPFVYDGDTMGIFSTSSTYETNTGMLSIDGSLQNNDYNEVIDIGGHVELGSAQKVALDIKLKETELKIFEPFLLGNISNMEGHATADLKITGTMAKPIAKGQLDFNGAGMTVVYLNTHYRFDHTFDLNGKTISFDSFKLLDADKNIATVDGTVDISDMERIRLTLDVKTDKFQVLNTN